LAGDPATFTVKASGTPPFGYTWKKDGVLFSQGANTITVNTVGAVDAGSYAVEVVGENGNATNSAFLTLLNPTNLTAQLAGGIVVLSWPPAYTGWTLQTRTNIPGADWLNIVGSQATNTWVISLGDPDASVLFRLTYP
jgi:hypothetical protein